MKSEKNPIIKSAAEENEREVTFFCKNGARIQAIASDF